jgi:hypothetical protein
VAAPPARELDEAVLEDAAAQVLLEVALYEARQAPCSSALSRNAGQCSRTS